MIYELIINIETRTWNFPHQFCFCQRQRLLENLVARLVRHRHQPDPANRAFRNMTTGIYAINLVIYLPIFSHR